MYASGGDHPNKAIAERFLLRVSEGEVEATIDAEVLQEILHRYLSIRRWSVGQRVYAVARRLFPQVLSITGPIVDQAKHIADTYPDISARDAVHAAVVIVHNLDGICTFDRDFDRIRNASA